MRTDVRGPVRTAQSDPHTHLFHFPVRCVVVTPFSLPLQVFTLLKCLFLIFFSGKPRWCSREREYRAHNTRCPFPRGRACQRGTSLKAPTAPPRHINPKATRSFTAWLSSTHATQPHLSTFSYAQIVDISKCTAAVTRPGLQEANRIRIH